MASKINGFKIQEATDIAASALFAEARKLTLRITSQRDADEVCSEITYNAKYKPASERTVLENWLMDDGTLVSDRMVARFNRLVATRIARVA